MKELMESLHATPLEFIFWIIVAIGLFFFFRAGWRNIKRE
jgi:hypothetical protein